MQLLSTWFEFRLKSYLTPSSSLWRQKRAERSGITLGDQHYTATKEQPSPDTGTPQPQLNPTLIQEGWRQTAHHLLVLQSRIDFPGPYQHIQATSGWECYRIRKTNTTSKHVIGQKSVRKLEKEKCPIFKELWECFLAQFLCPLGGLGLGFLRMERDNNSCFY